MNKFWIEINLISMMTKRLVWLGNLFNFIITKKNFNMQIKWKLVSFALKQGRKIWNISVYLFHFDSIYLLNVHIQSKKNDKNRINEWEKQNQQRETNTNTLTVCRERAEIDPLLNFKYWCHEQQITTTINIAPQEHWQ